MLTHCSPSEAYRKIDFDARVAGSQPQELTLLCYEQLVAALSRADFADRQADNAARSAALAQALSAVTALKLGTDPTHPIAEALQIMFENARLRILASVPVFDRAGLASVRADFAEIGSALKRS